MQLGWPKPRNFSGNVGNATSPPRRHCSKLRGWGSAKAARFLGLSFYLPGNHWPGNLYFLGRDHRFYRIDRNPNFDALVLKKKPFTIEKDPFFLLPSEFKRNTGFRNCRRNRPIMETDPSKDRACPNGNPFLRKGPFDNYRYPRLFILPCFFC